MRLNITKNFIIAFFVILAIYQTSKLWFEDFSNHNFIYSFFNNYSNSNDDVSLYSLESIIINQGSNKLLCIKNDIYNNDFKTVFDDAVKFTVENGTSISTNEFDWVKILSQKSIVYQYNCDINTIGIAKMFGFDESLLSAYSDKINTVIISPYITTTPESLIVGFGDRKSGKGCFYSIEKNQYIYTVYDTIGNISDNQKLYYTSTVINSLDIFKSNLFLPQWNSKFECNKVKAADPLLDNGQFQQFKLERVVDVFFDNPVSKWALVNDDGYTYSDETTVVKYFKTGVMEYYNYSAGKANSEKDFYNQYKSAVDVIKKDSDIKNEYYLSNFQSDDEKIVFFFDYKINNLCLKFGDEIKQNIGMSSPIEVTVSDGRVSKYKRYVRDFYLDENDKINVQKGFLKAVDEVFADIQKSNGKKADFIENMNLLYILDGDEKADLKWLVDVNQSQYTVSVENK